MLLKDAEGWNQTEQDWHRLLDLSPDGCFGIEHEGRLVATATTTSYGRELAWIGMVITAPEFRGRGLATRLLSAALEFLDARQTQWVKLDATSMGSGVYRKFGFVDECPVERWLRPPWPAGAPPLIPATGEWDAALDRRAFAADRSALLAMLAQVESASIGGAGFAMGRPGLHAIYFGPCVAADSLQARSLLEWFLARHASESIYWDLLPENQEAVDLARRYGFARNRQLMRMARGSGATPVLLTRPQEIYAIAGLEFG
jgi:RimJ/RimL family protein N-acetyltransferase